MKFTILEMGEVRLFAYGKFRWRSLDHAFPSLCGVDVVDDDPPHQVTHRWYQLAWCGLTLNLDIPTKKNRKGFLLDIREIMGTVGRLL